MRFLFWFVALIVLLALFGGHLLGFHSPVHITFHGPDWNWSIPGMGGVHGLGELLLGGIALALAAFVLLASILMLSASLIVIPLMILGCVLMGLLSPLLLPLGFIVLLICLFGRAPAQSS